MSACHSFKLLLAMPALIACVSSGDDQNRPPLTAGAAGAEPVGSGAGAGSGGAADKGMQSGGEAGGSTAGSAGSVGLGGAGGVSALAGAAGAGAPLGGGGSGGAAGATSFVCSQVQGLTLTREWYLAGFEQGVVDESWQLKAAQSAYVDEWAKGDSPFWETPLHSPCQNGSSTPDRVVFVVLSWTIMVQADWKSAIAGAVDTIESKYPDVRRIDLMTIIRGPENAPCGDPNAYAESTHIPPALDAAIAELAAASPSLVHVAPPFAVDACSDFSGTGPHLTSAGNAKLATRIAAALSTSSK